MLLLLAFSTHPARAETLHGVELPDSIERDGRTLRRLGMGTRTATAFRVKIYVAGLYVEEPDAADAAAPQAIEPTPPGAPTPDRPSTPAAWLAGDPPAILDDGRAKAIILQYLYTISRDDMKKGWEYYFAENCPARDCAPYRGSIDRFMSLVSEVEPGTRYTYFFFPDRIDIMRGADRVGGVAGDGFSRLLLSTWIGDVPPTEELKKALVGTAGNDRR